MITCKVNRHYGALLIVFPCGKSFLLQTDYDQAAFCYHCGLIGTDDPGSEEFEKCDPTTITQCPDDYLSVAA